MTVNLIAPDIGNMQVLYGPHGGFIRLNQLSEKGREILEPFAI